MKRLSHASRQVQSPSCREMVSRDIAVIHGLMSSRGHATSHRGIDVAFPRVGNTGAVAEENQIEQAALGDPRDILKQSRSGYPGPTHEPGSRHAVSTCVHDKSIAKCILGFFTRNPWFSPLMDRMKVAARDASTQPHKRRRSLITRLHAQVRSETRGRMACRDRGPAWARWTKWGRSACRRRSI